MVTDLVGYEKHLCLMEFLNLGKIPGNIIEIGCFLGGGTAKLAQYATAYNKVVYAVDIFDLSQDQSSNDSGSTMSHIYGDHLRDNFPGMSQYQVFSRSVEAFSNIKVLRIDSKALNLPMYERISFAFIDGNHNPDYIHNDFNKVWEHVTEGGIVAFHDYGGDLPLATEAIDDLIALYRDGISNVILNSNIWTVYLQKRSSASGEPLWWHFGSECRPHPED